MLWYDRLATRDALELAPSGARCVPWLSPGEQDRLRDLGRGPRASEWLAGRSLAKQVLKACLPQGTSPADVHIESRDGRDRAVSPRVFLRGRLLPWSLSVSHTRAWVYAAVSSNMRLGVDVVELDGHASRALDCWLTAGERRWCQAQGPTAYGLIWSLKESLYKADNQGEAFFPKTTDVWEALGAHLDYLASALVGDGPRECVARYAHGTVVVRRDRSGLTTLVARPPLRSNRANNRQRHERFPQETLG